MIVNYRPDKRDVCIVYVMFMLQNVIIIYDKQNYFLLYSNKSKQILYFCVVR